jgi:competence CoiA-like predicted nuclease
MFIGIVNNKRITIDEYINGDITCPCCGSQLIAKRGQINVHHFAHKTLQECDEWYEMSQWHKEWQNKFPEQYREIILEKDGKKHINDVKIGNLCIEFQYSPILVTNINKRNSFYTEFGKLVWLFDVRDVKKNISKQYNDELKWKWKSKSILMASDNNVYVYLQVDENKIFRIDYFKNYKPFVSELSSEEFLNDLRKLYKNTNFTNYTN